MGADLYIQSLYEPNRAQWEPRFEAAVERRDSLLEGSMERAEAQEAVERCFDQMLSQGYFRDPYNNSDLLWQFGLSWWTDVIPMLDADGRLSVAKAVQLRDLLTRREDEFEERLAAMADQREQCFRNRYVELRQFLNQAIALGEAIDCSL